LRIYLQDGLKKEQQWAHVLYRQWMKCDGSSQFFSNATTKYHSLFLYFLSSRFSGYKLYYFYQSTQLFCSIASKRSFVLTFLTSRTRSCIFLILIFHDLVLLLNEKKIINFSRIKLPLLHLQILLKNFGGCLDECFDK